MSRLADRYENLHPGTGVSESQAEERMERIDFNREKASHRRTGRLRGIVVPASPAFTAEGRLRG